MCSDRFKSNGFRRGGGQDTIKFDKPPGRTSRAPFRRLTRPESVPEKCWNKLRRKLCRELCRNPNLSGIRSTKFPTKFPTKAEKRLWGTSSSQPTRASLLFDHPTELGEERCRIVRSRRGFWMILYAKDWLLPVSQPFH